MFRTKLKTFEDRLIDWIDCRPRTMAYLAFMLFVNFVWDALGHWPL